MKIDTWHVHAEICNSPYIATIYGIKTEKEAEQIARKFRGLSSRVVIHHTTKGAGKRDPWHTDKKVVKDI